MKIFKLLPALCILILCSCQQEIDPNILSDPGDDSTGGNPSNSFQPLTVGSWWKFKDSTSAEITTLTSTPVTTSINNISFRAIKSENSQGVDSVYMASPAPQYYYSASGVSPSAGTFDLTFNYLNDTASVGYSWEYIGGQGNDFVALMKTTILEKGITVTIQGNTYTDVTHTRLDLSYDVMGIIMDAGFYDYYFAPGIGMIRVRAQLGLMGSVALKTCSDLVEYHLE